MIRPPPREPPVEGLEHHQEMPLGLGWPWWVAAGLAAVGLPVLLGWAIFAPDPPRMAHPLTQEARQRREGDAAPVEPAAPRPGVLMPPSDPAEIARRHFGPRPAPQALPLPLPPPEPGSEDDAEPPFPGPQPEPLPATAPDFDSTAITRGRRVEDTNRPGQPPEFPR